MYIWLNLIKVKIIWKYIFNCKKKLYHKILQRIQETQNLAKIMELCKKHSIFRKTQVCEKNSKYCQNISSQNAKYCKKKRKFWKKNFAIQFCNNIFLKWHVLKWKVKFPTPYDEEPFQNVLHFWLSLSKKKQQNNKWSY